MPEGLDGYQLGGQVRRLHPQIAVIYTSGYSEEALRGRGELARGDAFLAKPYAQQELATTVSAALRGRR